MQKRTSLITATKILGVTALLFLSGCTGHYQGTHYGDEHIFKQDTMFSVQDSMPGHSTNQMALLRPLEKNILYTGTLPYTASKPVEMVALDEYVPVQEPDSAHEVRLIGAIGGKRYAILVRQFPNAVPITYSATIPFSGSALALQA